MSCIALFSLRLSSTKARLFGRDTGQIWYLYEDVIV
nr:MAG TPA: L-lactate dehydrogenase [Caudoviricetes sp.]